MTNLRFLAASLLAITLTLTAATAANAQDFQWSPSGSSDSGTDSTAPGDNGAGTGSAGATAQSAEELELAGQWENFLYQIRVARPELAVSYARALINADRPQDLYQLSTETANWDRTLSWGSRNEELAPLIDRIRGMIEQGYELQRSDPDHIRRSIDMLDDNIRAYRIGSQRLQESGQYALPQMIQRLSESQTSQVLRDRIINVLPNIGLEAVHPLVEVLESNDPQLLVIAANALGQIGYPHAAPALKELIEKPDLLPKVRTAAEQALVMVAGRDTLAKPAAELYYQYAQNYYYKAESLRPDPRFDTANVWDWVPGRDLTYLVVPAEIYNDIYAMRCAAAALANDPQYDPAVSLWIAANLRREANLPQGAQDPTRRTNEPPADFYALAGSAQYLQDVLARAIDDTDARVAFGAIQALAKTSGSKNLVKSVDGGVQPLVKALSYPDRPVRYLAAISLAGALPDEDFAGADVVIPVLGEALRQTGAPRALLVVADETLANRLQDALRAAQYDVIRQGDPVQALADARQAGGVDVVVMAGNPDPADMLSKMQQDTMFAALPIVVAPGGSARISQMARENQQVIQIDPVDEVGVARALEEARTSVGGSMLTPEQAAQWAVRSAQAAEMLSLTNNRVLDVTRMQNALVEALQNPRADVRVAAADALAQLDRPAAQQAVAELALDADVDNQVRIDAFKALSKSLRKTGNMLTEGQASRTVEVVNSDAAMDLRVAAAQALGAMNLPSEQIRPLIPRQ